MRMGVGMKGWIAALDAACAWANPGLVVLAVVIALLDVAAAAQHWTVARLQAPVAVRTVIVAAKTEQCSPALPPELRDMIGRD
jgi:hypothetical protein